MTDHYTGYLAIEKIAFCRKDPRLKPTRCLRFWYLAQSLDTAVTKEKLLERWGRQTGLGASSCQKALLAGMGIYWDVINYGQGPVIRMRTAAELHTELGVKMEKQRRFAFPLTRPTQEWHRHIVESHIMAYRRGTDGITEPVTRQQIAESCGMARMSVVQHIRASKKINIIPQLAKVEEEGGEPGDYRARFPHSYLRRLKGFTGLWRRLPDRFQVKDHRITPLGWRTTWLGWVMRIGLMNPLGVTNRLVQLWDNLHWPNYVREVV